jgi:CBS domain-containing protein
MYLRSNSSETVKQAKKSLANITRTIEGLFVGSVMSKDLITLKIDSSVGLAEEIMRLKAINHVPIVDDAGVLIGLVTGKDILRSTCQTQTFRETCLRQKMADDLLMRDVMRGGLITVKRDTLVTKAAKVIIDNGVGCLPVIDVSGVLVGMLTERDFVNIMAKNS